MLCSISDVLQPLTTLLTLRANGFATVPPGFFDK